MFMFMKDVAHRSRSCRGDAQRVAAKRLGTTSLGSLEPACHESTLKQVHTNDIRYQMHRRTGTFQQTVAILPMQPVAALEQNDFI